MSSKHDRPPRRTRRRCGRCVPLIAQRPGTREQEQPAETQGGAHQEAESIGRGRGGCSAQQKREGRRQHAGQQHPGKVGEAHQRLAQRVGRLAILGRGRRHKDRHRVDDQQRPTERIDQLRHDGPDRTHRPRQQLGDRKQAQPQRQHPRPKQHRAPRPDALAERARRQAQHAEEQRADAIEQADQLQPGAEPQEIDHPQQLGDANERGGKDHQRRVDEPGVATQLGQEVGAGQFHLWRHTLSASPKRSM